MKVNLSDLIEAIEFENEMMNHYYNKKTGIIIYKENSDTAAYDSEDIHKIATMEEWERELVENLHDLKENPQDYIKLPGNEEIDELKLMIDFCNSFSDISIRESLTTDNDYYRRLDEVKNIILDKDLINDWYDYREEAERDIAVEWCRKNNIDYIE